MPEKSDQALVIAIVRTVEGRIKRRFLQLLEDLEDQLGLATLSRILREGNFSEIIQAVDRLAARLAQEVLAGYTYAAQNIAQHLGTTVAFDTTNVRAVEQMRQAQLHLVREVADDARDGIREALTSGVQRGINPIDQAREVQASLGLTRWQVQQVDSYRDKLISGDMSALRRKLRDKRFDRTVRRAQRTKKPLTPAQVKQMTDRYRERWVKYRSEVIARTESLRSVHLGAEEMYRQALEQGAFGPEDITRTWRTAHDPKVRHSHRYMNGQKRRLGEPFLSGNGAHLRWPGDLNAPGSDTIQCRCVVTTRVRV